jgi:hypothetical protein
MGEKSSNLVTLLRGADDDSSTPSAAANVQTSAIEASRDWTTGFGTMPVLTYVESFDANKKFVPGQKVST